MASNLTEMLAELEAETVAAEIRFAADADPEVGLVRLTPSDARSLIAAVWEVMEDRDAWVKEANHRGNAVIRLTDERDDTQRRLAEAVASNVRLIKEMDAQGQALFIAEQILDGENLSVMKAERDTLKAKLAECERERKQLWAMFRLINAEYAFVGFEDYGFFRPAEDFRPDLKLSFNVLCSDTFAWACADAETITLEQAPILLQLVQDGGWSALMKWVQDKRGGPDAAPFIEPVRKHVSEIDSLREQLREARAQAETDRLLLADAMVFLGMDPEEDDVPPHDCQFISDPEQGGCNFHEFWGDAVAALARSEGEASK